MHYAGQVAMDRKPGRIGFMSTQRRENRSTPATETCRRGPRYRWRRTSCTRRSEVSGIFSPSPVARCTCSIASGRTASVSHPSDQDLSPGTPVRLATNSLQSDYRIVQLVQVVLFVCQDVRQLSPPFGAGPGVTTETPATHGSSPPHIPSPSGHARLHPTLPRVPAG